MTACAKCGAANGDGARFCGVCGAAVSGTEPSPRAGMGAGAAAGGPGPAMLGREIAGRYRVLAKLGEGGMGAVFRAEQISLKRTVAIKLLRPDVAADPMLLRRFNAEAELVAKLGHPNTVNIYDFGQDTDGTLFIAMELIDGRSLRAVIHREAPLPPRRALAIAAQIAASLSDAHAHAIIHRDLKPDNVMLQDRGRERDVVRVLDFGIAKLRDDARATQRAMTQAGDMVGTPQYMAPEQIRGEAVDGRTDVYALGCLIYELVTARLPHDATTVLAMLSKHLLDEPVPPSQRRPELGLPPALDALILGAMAKDPRARPPTMDAYAEQIAALMAALPPVAPSALASGAQPMQPAQSAPAVVTPVAYSAVTPVAYSAMSSVAQLPMSAPGGPAMSSGAQPPMRAPGGPAMSSGAPSPSGAPVPHGTSPGGGGYPPASPIPPAGASPRPGAPPPSARPKRAAAIAAAVGLVAAGTIATVVLGQRGAGAPEPRPAAAGSGASTADPWAGSASGSGSAASAPPPPPAHDPWAAPPPGSGEAAVADRKIAVGGGVQLAIPADFQISQQNGGIVAFDARGVVIAAGPIVVASNDPQELARAHARLYHLTFDRIRYVSVLGASRPVAIFHGTLAGVLVHQTVLVLIGPRYRVAVAFQYPAPLDSDPSVKQLLGEIYGRRIELPLGGP